MSMTDPNARTTDGISAARSTTDTDRPRGGFEARYRALRETKPSFLTTEFWAMVAGIVALVVLYNVTDNPDLTLWRTSLLATIIAAAYIVSRGWAKSGSHDDHVVSDRR
jgi:hypothetical protein